MPQWGARDEPGRRHGVGKDYYEVLEGKKRYIWLATRMGRLAIKDTPGIEIIQTYKLIERDK